jgi:DnaJ-domain-containing protein 1
MADEEHLAILKKGVEVWNEWRRENPDIIPDLGGTDLSGINLDGFDLHQAALWNSFFGGSSLRGALLTWAFLQNSYLLGIDLTGADLRRASLQGANLSLACLYRANLRGAFLNEVDLSSADLREADLYQASICKTNLIAARLDGANLSEAFLAYTHALATNFEGVVLTGACIEALNTDSRTDFNNVVCDYVYLRYEKEERRPHDRNFKPGEFTKLFQKARETVDLIFLNGIDWQAFLVSFQQVQVEAGDKALFIQAIENKNDGAFVIRVSVPPELDKSQIEQYFKQKYQLAIEAKEQQYRKYLRERLKDKDDLIASYREQMTSVHQNSTKLIGIIETMAENENTKKENIFNIYGSPGSVANQGHIASSGNQNNIGNAAGEAQYELKSIQHIHHYAPEQKQTLAEAAAEIQQLLKQLEQTNPSATEAEKKAYVTASVPPTLRARTVSALKAGGKEALKELLDNPYVNIGVAIVEGWQSPE